MQGNNKFNVFIISNLFLKNFGGRLSLILALLALAAVFVLSSLIMKKLAWVNSSIWNALDKIRNFIQWNLIISVYIASFIPMVLSVMVQLRYTTSLSYWFGFYSYGLATLGAILTFGSLIPLFLFGRLQESELKEKTVLVNRTRVLLNKTSSESKGNSVTNSDETTKGRYWAFLLCTRNFFLVSFISTLSDSPIVQCVISSVVNLCLFSLMLKWRFFEKKIQSQLMRICEALNTVIPMFFLVYEINFLKKENGNSPFGITNGWTIIVLISVTTLLNCLFQIIEAYYMLNKFWHWSNKVTKVLIDYLTGRDIRKIKEDLKKEEKERLKEDKTNRTPTIVPDIVIKDVDETNNLHDVNKSQLELINLPEINCNVRRSQDNVYANILNQSSDQLIVKSQINEDLDLPRSELRVAENNENDNLSQTNKSQFGGRSYIPPLAKYLEKSLHDI